MAAPAPPRIDDLEIPDRPAVASETQGGPLMGKRVLLYGGIAAAALLALVAIALLRSGSDEVARAPADAPLIKAEDQPIKVSPESPGGMEVPNRDILVYERMHGTPAGKRPVERLLPEPEQPLTPPPRPAETTSAPIPPPIEPPIAPGEPRDASLSAPPAAEPASKLPEAADTPPPVVVKPKGEPARTKTAPQPPPTQAKAATSPAAAQPEKPASGSAFHLQLLSSRSADEANNAWARLKGKNGDLLGALSPSVARADLGDRGTFYRLRAGPIASESKARSICDSLSARGVSCLVVRSSS
jgi:cell division septation protein DedD